MNYVESELGTKEYFLKTREIIIDDGTTNERSWYVKNEDLLDAFSGLDDELVGYIYGVNSKILSWERFEREDIYKGI